MKLPKAEQEATEWQTAVEMLMLVGEHVDSIRADVRAVPVDRGHY